MSAQNNGGPAFPAEYFYDPETGYERMPAVGMTLRDRFAIAALQGFLADPKPFYKMDHHESIADAYAQESYIYADAMLKAREQ